MHYLFVKHLHMTCAVLSGAFFFVRGLWMLADSRQLQRKWVRIAPHVIDTLLLVSAIILVWWSGQLPGEQAWLSAKVIALVLYILLGMVAIRHGRSKPVRSLAFVGALVVFAYILGVAVTRQVWFFL